MIITIIKRKRSYWNKRRNKKMCVPNFLFWGGALILLISFPYFSFFLSSLQFRRCGNGAFSLRASFFCCFGYFFFLRLGAAVLNKQTSLQPLVIQRVNAFFYFSLSLSLFLDLMGSGFTGFTGFYWVLLGFTGFLHGFTEFYQVLPRFFTGFF